MRQQSLADEGFERYRKPTRRDQFLAEMEQIIPWRDLCKVIKPFYPKPKGAGRPPIGLERMLRIHFLQHWFNLSDPAVEETLYDTRAMRRFVGIDLGHDGPAQVLTSTAGREIAQLLAVLRLLGPWPQHRRKTSFIFRMDNLCAGICASSDRQKKGAGYRGLSPRQSLRMFTPSAGGRIHQNRWQPSYGMGGSFAVESVAGLVWNTHATAIARENMLAIGQQHRTDRRLGVLHPPRTAPVISIP